MDLAEALEGIFAFNGPLSQCGWASLLCHHKALDLCPNAVCKTGSHANSAHTVAESTQISRQLMRKLGRLSEPMIQWQKRYL